MGFYSVFHFIKEKQLFFLLSFSDSIVMTLKLYIKITLIKFESWHFL